MNIKFDVRWNTRSKAWINAMPGRVSGALASAIAIGVRRAGLQALNYARADMPVFEGTAHDALGIIGNEEGDNAASVMLGFNDESVIMPSEDVRTASEPYNYAWGKHSPGAEPHKVYLYNYETGDSTRGRAKLVRWLKANVGDPFTQLPPAPTAEYWNRNDTSDGPPPYVTVDPRRTATPYFSDVVNNATKRNAIFQEISGAVGRHIGGVW